MASRTNFGLAYKAQTVLGTAATAPYALVPWSAFDTGIQFNRIDDPTGLGTRFGALGRAGTLQVQPRITVPYRTTAFDDFLASMFMGAWTTNVLVQANTPTYLTVEDRQSDAGAGFAAVYQDVIPNQLQLNVPLNGLVEAQFTCLATLYTDSATLTTSPTAAVTDAPFDSLHGTFSYGGSSYKMTSIQLTMDNRGEARYVLGTATPDRLVFNPDRVTVRMTALFDGVARLDDARNDTSRALAFTLVQGAKSHAFSLPNVHVTNWAAPVTNDAERVQNIELEAGPGGSGWKVSLTRV